MENLLCFLLLAIRTRVLLGAVIVFVLNCANGPLPARAKMAQNNNTPSSMTKPGAHSAASRVCGAEGSERRGHLK